jgi:hypothetical protein
LRNNDPASRECKNDQDATMNWDHACKNNQHTTMTSDRINATRSFVSRASFAFHTNFNYAFMLVCVGRWESESSYEAGYFGLACSWQTI